MSRPDLPDFDNPPVSEVAFSIQFDALPKFRAIHLGELWTAFGRQDFPATEEQPSLPENRERATPTRVDTAPRLEILNIPPMPRYFYISSSGTEVIQVQQNRFGFNWRKRTGSDVYPRFEALMAAFERYFASFEGFLAGEKLGSVKINQAELTYVNDIETAPAPGVLKNVISVFSGQYSDNFLHDPEDFRMSLRYPMMQDGQFAGRLYIDAHPSTLSDTKAGLNLVLLSRGKPFKSDIEGARAFFQLARTYIVSGFTSITSEQMHQMWRRTDNV